MPEADPLINVLYLEGLFLNPMRVNGEIQSNRLAIKWMVILLMSLLNDPVPLWKWKSFFKCGHPEVSVYTWSNGARSWMDYNQYNYTNKLTKPKIS